MQTVIYTFPQNGMNSTIDAQVLPNTFGAFIENLTFEQATNGFLRYGTKVLSPLQNNEIEITSLTTGDEIATAITATHHELGAASRVAIVGAYPLGYNVTNKRIQYVDANTFRYSVDENYPASTGAPRLRISLKGTEQNLESIYGQSIIKFFDYFDSPLVVVAVRNNYVVNATIAEDRQTLTIQNYTVPYYAYLSKGNKVDIKYTLNNLQYTLTADVLEDTIDGANLILKLNYCLPTDEITINNVDFYSAEFHKFNESSGAYTKVSGDRKFFAWTSYRSAYFLNKLIIVNGKDSPQVWDGNVLEELKFTEKLTNNTLRNYTALAQNRFRAEVVDDLEPFRSTEIRIAFFYKNMQITEGTVVNVNKLEITTPIKHALQVNDEILISRTGFDEYDKKRFRVVSVVSDTVFRIETFGNPDDIEQDGNGVFNLLPVLRSTTITLQAERIEITLADDIFPELPLGNPFTSDNIRIQYVETISQSGELPAFRDIIVAHDRLWALGAGVETSVSTIDAENSMYVYYCHSANSITDWINPNTRTLPFIDLQLKQNTKDQLNTMKQLSSGMVFIGRESTQIWEGSDPTLDTGSLQFVWRKTFPMGCLHGNLVQSIGNDVVMMTKFGLMSLSSLSLVEDYQASDEITKDINFTLKSQLQKFLNDDFSYLKTRSFVYPTGNMLGFRLVDYCFIFENAAYSKGWVLFSGDFKQAGDITRDAHKNRLILAIDNILYAYGDHSPFSFADKDGTQAIFFKWMTPLATFNNTWANQRVELEANATQPCTINVGLLRTQNLLDAPSLSYTPTADKSYWNQGGFGSSFWSTNAQNNLVKKFKFASFNLGAVVSGYGNSELQLELKRLIFYGMMGR